jgi:hypothetical protein
LIVKVSNSGRKPSKKARDKQKAAWKAWCEKYGLKEQTSKQRRQLAMESIVRESSQLNKFGQIQR